jgi:pimeloyl-ACP methyl ester carboxylesterase
MTIKVVRRTLAALLFLPATAFAQATSPPPSCSAPPRIDCPEANCKVDLVRAEGNAIEPKTGRKFFLDYPCDLKPNEPVVFVLSLHGAGSIGNWQRHYFPIVDLKEKYRLVVATPTAATAEPTRRWAAEADDAFLQHLVDYVFERFGHKNIRAFWLAGHSQGGMTSRRIICSEYFRDRVDGWISLSGGRIGQTRFTFARTGSPTPSPSGAPATQGSSEQLPTCDFSFIFTAGQLEIERLPETSPWAEKYGCAPRERRPDIVDARAGYVTATDQSRGPSWGRFARPGTAEAYAYPKCRDGMVVADVVRLDKGHTEGLEPNVTEEIVKLMVAAPGGKAQRR